jgi:hypothetical protein
MSLDFGKGLQHEGNKAAFLDINLCKMLSKGTGLGKLIMATRVSARKQIRESYVRILLRPDTVSAAYPESKLERALWLHWGLHKLCATNPKFLNECPHIVSYQVPLYNCKHKKDRDGWGKIDVIGLLSEDLTPVVIELKAGVSNESLLRTVLEAVAYAIAVQEAWKPRFFQDWKVALKELASADHSLINQGSLTRIPTNLTTCRILCAAPTEYWKRYHEERKCTEFKELLSHLGDQGFIVSFARLDFTVQLV